MWKALPADVRQWFVNEVIRSGTGYQRTNGQQAAPAGAAAHISRDAEINPHTGLLNGPDLPGFLDRRSKPAPSSTASASSPGYDFQVHQAQEREP